MPERTASHRSKRIVVSHKLQQTLSFARAPSVTRNRSSPLAESGAPKLVLKERPSLLLLFPLVLLPIHEERCQLPA
jgi:hypothetical protein